MDGRLRLLPIGLALPVLALAGLAQAVELDPAVVTVTTPEQYQWRDPANKGPGNQVPLLGDGKTGHYVHITKWNKGHNFSRPHFHPNDRHFVVISGTWWLGSGEKYAPNSTVAASPGTYVFHKGKGIHYDGAKAEEVVIQVWGVGPDTSTAAEVK